MTKRMNDEERAASFSYWFKWTGHWCYSRTEALRVWEKRGIDGLPDCTTGALALLSV